MLDKINRNGPIYFFPNMSRFMVFQIPSFFSLEDLVRPTRIIKRAGKRTERDNRQDAPAHFPQLGQLNGSWEESVDEGGRFQFNFSNRLTPSFMTLATLWISHHFSLFLSNFARRLANFGSTS